MLGSQHEKPDNGALKPSSTTVLSSLQEGNDQTVRAEGTAKGIWPLLLGLGGLCQVQKSPLPTGKWHKQSQTLSCGSSKLFWWLAGAKDVLVGNKAGDPGGACYRPYNKVVLFHRVEYNQLYSQSQNKRFNRWIRMKSKILKSYIILGKQYSTSWSYLRDLSILHNSNVSVRPHSAPQELSQLSPLSFVNPKILTSSISCPLCL